MWGIFRRGEEGRFKIVNIIRFCRLGRSWKVYFYGELNIEFLDREILYIVEGKVVRLKIEGISWSLLIECWDF